MPVKKLVLHMVSSLDGFIGREDGDISWMECGWSVYEKGVPEDHGAEEMSTIDCFLLGSGTYEMALKLGWPYGETPVAVFSHRDLKSERPTVEFVRGDLQQVLASLKEKYSRLWLVGGAKLSREFLRLGLVDEIRHTILPILLGEGIPFFGPQGREEKLQLRNVTTFRNGMVELDYLVIRS